MLNRVKFWLNSCVLVTHSTGQIKWWLVGNSPCWCWQTRHIGDTFYQFTFTFPRLEVWQVACLVLDSATDTSRPPSDGSSWQIGIQIAKSSFILDKFYTSYKSCFKIWFKTNQEGRREDKKTVFQKFKTISEFKTIAEFKTIIWAERTCLKVHL